MSSLVGDRFYCGSGRCVRVCLAPRLGVINQLVWLCLLYCRSAGRLSVALGFFVVPKVFVYPGAQFVRCGVVALEQFDVPVHVG